MRYLEEQKEWDSVVLRVAGPQARLLSVSANSSDCRVYSSPSAIYKMRRITPASCRLRLNSLEDEFLILRRLKAIPGIPAARAYQRFEAWEVIEMNPLPQLRGYDPTFGRPREALQDFMAVARLTLKINRLGCSHGDLHVGNVGRNVENGLSVFDFDQAQPAHPLRCMLRDFCGFAAGTAGSKVSLLDRARDVRGIGLVPRAIGALGRASAAAAATLYRGPVQSRGPSISTLSERASLQNDPALESLARAWELAARWSHLDLNDGTIRGGMLDNLSLGVNWHLNNNLRVQFMYLHSNRYNLKAGVIPGDVDGLGIRTQFTF